MAPVARKIRVLFIDPDDTDSSSDDEGAAGQCRKKREKKRAVKEILAATKVLRNPKSRKNPKALKTAAAGSKPREAPPERRFRGVYQRQPGRWVSEFRDRSMRIREWLGTFDSESEAKAAYDAFERRIRGAKSSVSTSVSASASASTCLSSSSSSEKMGEEEAGFLLESLLAEELADEDLVGLADLGHLPLPFLDRNLDLDACDFSVFDLGCQGKALFT